ncbi:MAG: hypothetical protein ACKO95_11745 [Dolichospermum sp.]
MVRGQWSVVSGQWSVVRGQGSGQGVFILGGKKEMKSDLLLIKLQKDHYSLSFKIC